MMPAKRQQMRGFADILLQMLVLGAWPWWHEGVFEGI
jgi:hypothetical protein